MYALSTDILKQFVFEFSVLFLTWVSVSDNRLQLSASLGVGLQYDKHEKLRYSVRGKKTFPVTTDGLLSFNVKGQCDVDKEFREVGPLFSP